jgi:probable F420-dependent oxidoreductase
VNLKIGVVFPQTEFGSDPTAVRDYAQTAEGLGYSHVVAYDHVLGANPDRPEGFIGPYTHEASFLEPFVLFSYMAGVTASLGFAPGVLVLPQRQTALVAKQAATLDVLSGGRLRLGVGIGWNAVEYRGMGEDFHTRGRRIEEQVALLRRLWTEPLVTFEGRWHRLPDVGINPLPVQRPIPVWFGGRADAALRRIARLGDGWMVHERSPAEARPQVEKFSGYLAQAGRSRSGVGLEARLNYGEGDAEAWAREIDAWRELGVDYLALNTMRAGLDTPAEHLGAIRRFAEEAGWFAAGKP